MKFETAIMTNQGGRSVNQDYVAFKEDDGGGCWVLADGLGGAEAGELAAKIAVHVILKEYQDNHKSKEWMKRAIEKTQAALHWEQKSLSLRKGMRTTVVVLACKNNLATWAHVGDSRLYHLRDGKILTRTKDHSVCQALVNAGEITIDEIRFHEDRNRLYRVLGTDGAVKATIVDEEIELLAGDSILLCSDGLWEYITEADMEETRLISTSPHEWLTLMEFLLKKRVSENNDNYSAVAVFVNSKKHE